MDKNNIYYNNKLYNTYINNIKLPKSLDLYENMDQLVNYLRLIRDYHILNCPMPMDETHAEIINTLHTAISEYKKYKDCINKYYKVENGIPTSLSGDKDTLSEYAAEKAEHWKNFWAIIAVNAESWFELHDLKL